MKKAIALLLVLTFLGVLCACEGGGASRSQNYAVTLNGVKVEIDAEAGHVLYEVGSWLTYDESPSCAFEGLDKIYNYGAFEILTYPLEGQDFIAGVYLNDDTVATEEGIAIGVDRDAVIRAYGEADSQNETYLRYEGEGMSLTFLLKDGRVTNIQYLKNT